jgi:cell division protease FtsH
MKKMKTPRMAYRMLPKSLAAVWTMPSSSLESYVAQMHGQPADEESLPYPEPDFYLDPEDEEVTPNSSYSDGEIAVVGAAFDAAVSPQSRRQIDHAKALAVVIIVPTPAWVAPVSAHFRTTFGSRWQAYERVGSSRGGGYQEGSDSVASDLSRGHCVVGLAPDVTSLPGALVAAADITIRLPAPTGAVLRMAIARFCRRPSNELPGGIATGLDLYEIATAFRPGTGPQRIAQRLAAAAVAVRQLPEHAQLEQEDEC